jgi:hypothetical protein
MPQHEVANGNGQSEFDLARPMTLSNVVANIPGAEYPSGGATLVYVIIYSFQNDKLKIRINRISQNTDETGKNLNNRTKPGTARFLMLKIQLYIILHKKNRHISTLNNYFISFHSL